MNVKLNIYSVIIFLGIAILAGPEQTVSAQPANGSDAEWKKKYDFEQTREKFKEPPLFYAPHTFWFWDTAPDPKLMDVFIPIAHASCQKYLGEYMGNVIPGVFVDNEGNCGFKMAWSEYLVERYREMKGSDMRRFLPLLTEKKRNSHTGRQFDGKRNGRHG